MHTYYVYIMASKRNGTLYLGMTNDIIRRVYEHKNNINAGFTEKYDIHRLVYYESTNDVNAAITREKRMKKWKRQWKINLIEERNPEWRDLSDGFYSEDGFLLRRNDRCTLSAEVVDSCLRRNDRYGGFLLEFILAEAGQE